MGKWGKYILIIGMIDFTYWLEWNEIDLVHLIKTFIECLLHIKHIVVGWENLSEQALTPSRMKYIPIMLKASVEIKRRDHIYLVFQLVSHKKKAWNKILHSHTLLGVLSQESNSEAKKGIGARADSKCKMANYQADYSFSEYQMVAQPCGPPPEKMPGTVIYPS